MRRGWAITVAISAAVFTAGGIALALAPGLVQRRVEAALHAAGYPDARIADVRLGWGSAELLDLTLDAHGTLAVASTTATWRWSEVIHGRLASLRISGLRVVLAAGPTGPEVTPLLPLPDPARSGAGAGWPAALPVDRLDLAGTARLGTLEVELTALARDLGAGRCWAEVEVSSAGAAIAVTGTLDGHGPEGEVRWQDLPVTAWAGQCSAPLPALAGALPIATSTGMLRWDGQRWSGRLSAAGPWGGLVVDGSGDQRSGTGHLNASDIEVSHLWTAAGPWLPALPLSEPSGRLNAGLAATWDGPDWTTAGRIALDRLALTTPWAAVSSATIVAEGRCAADPAGPVLVGALRVEPAAVVLRSGLPGQEVAVPSLVITSDGRRLQAEGDLQAAGATVHLTAQSARDGSQGTAQLTLAGVDLAVWQARLAAWLPVSVPVAVTGTAAATVDLARTGDRLQADGALTVTDLGVSAAGLVAHAGSVTVAGEATLDGAEPSAASAVVTVAGGGLELPAAGLRVSALSGTLPWTLQGSLPRTASGLSTVSGDLRGDVSVAGLSLPAVRVRAQASGTTLSGRVDARLEDLLTASAEGVITSGPEGLAADLRVQVPRTVVDDPSRVAAALPMLAPWRLNGVFAMDGTVAVRGTQVIPVLHVSLSEATLAQAQAKLDISGLNAGLTVVGFTPLRTAPRQPVSAERVAVAGQELTSLAGRVSLDGDRLHIEDGGFAWGGGTVSLPVVDADLAGRTAQAEVRVRGIGLDAICAAAAKDQVAAEGRLAGRIPLGITWPDIRITLGDGRLEADPPTGWVRITDRAMIAQAVGSGNAIDARIRERVVDAVQEFSFTRLTLTTSRDQFGLLTRADVVGKGRRGDDPLELGGLGFNIRGVEEGLAEALRLGRTLTPADDTLDRFFGD
jgi:hypothetical protein